MPHHCNTHATVPITAPEYSRHRRACQISNQSVAMTTREPSSAHRTPRTLSTGSAATTTRSYRRRCVRRWEHNAHANPRAVCVGYLTPPQSHHRERCIRLLSSVAREVADFPATLSKQLRHPSIHPLTTTGVDGKQTVVGDGNPWVSTRVHGTEASVADRCARVTDRASTMTATTLTTRYNALSAIHPPGGCHKGARNIFPTIPSAPTT